MDGFVGAYYKFGPIFSYIFEWGYFILSFFGTVRLVSWFHQGRTTFLFITGHAQKFQPFNVLSKSEINLF